VLATFETVFTCSGEVDHKVERVVYMSWTAYPWSTVETLVFLHISAVIMPPESRSNF